ncbi:MAG TPA: lysophospholipid acyltransferase family protein [Rhodanobacteraceae bacterium]|nr:lysophospholipid acyltransferase family protein [Rhodanobacteraceae bacterium]
MSAAQLPRIPPNMPQFRPSLATAMCRWLLGVFGWRMVGDLPDIAKVVVIAAPHSTNWDVIWGLLFKISLRLDVHFIGKREAFVWPLGPILRAFGGIPVDRSAAHGLVGEMRRQFEARDRFWLALAPEGTRKKVQKWKTGFWHIAREAGVPVLPVYFHYPEKTVGLGPLFHPTDDVAADMARIREFYRPWIGKNRGTV